MKNLHPRTILLIRHRADLRIRACGPHRNGRYAAWLLLPLAAGGELIAKSVAMYETPEDALDGMRAEIRGIVKEAEQQGYESIAISMSENLISGNKLNETRDRSTSRKGAAIINNGKRISMAQARQNALNGRRDSDRLMMDELERDAARLERLETI